MNSTAAPSQAEIQAIENLASDIRSFSYVVVASVTFLLYDILITYSEEVEFIWGSKSSFGKACYVVNRYGTLALTLAGLSFYLHPNPEVKIWYYVSVWTAMIIVFPIQVILLLRAYALHAGNQAVKWFLVFCIVAQVCCEIGDYSLSSASVKFGPAPFGGFSCLLTVSALPTKAGLINYATQTAFDGAIFLVSAVKLVKLMLAGRSKLAWILLKDSLTYLFLLIFGALVTFLLFLVLPASHATLKEITSSFMLAMASTIASRLILNLRGYVRTPRLDTTTILTAANPENIRTHGELRFAEHTMSDGISQADAPSFMEMGVKP